MISTVFKFAKWLLLSAFVFGLIVVFGEKPLVKTSRIWVKEVLGWEYYFTDRKDGLDVKKHKKYIAGLAKQYNGTASTPQMITLPQGLYIKGCLGEVCDPAQGHGEWQDVARFEIAATEVTVEQWDICVAQGGCEHMPDNYGWGRGDLPVLNVSWNDVQVYLKWLNSVSLGGYRLPSDAEWEYAARAGTTTRFPWGDSLPDCDKVRHGSPAWVSKNDWKCSIVGTWSVNSRAANKWGLYNMIGNAAEWVQECGSARKLAQAAAELGSSSESCRTHINRGGNWSTDENTNSLHSRNYLTDQRYNRVGFRLARDSEVVSNQ